MGGPTTPVGKQPLASTPPTLTPTHFPCPPEEVCPPWIGSSSSTSLIVYNHILFVLLKFLLIRTLELKFCEKQLKEMTS